MMFAINRKAIPRAKMASPPRSPKRPRSVSNAAPNTEEEKKTKQPRLSPPSDAAREDTQRIVTQMLREENRQFSADRDALAERLARTQRSLRDAEDDVARVYRQKQKEMDALRREFEQKMVAPAGQAESKEISSTVVYSRQTAAEMDRFLQSCELWQTRLRTLSGQLERKAEKMEAQELQSVVRDLVTSVEVQALKSEVGSTRGELQWALWAQEDAAKCLEACYRDRQDTEVFEAIEKQLTDDRVVELETQLAQKRAVEREKEMELSSLRAGQEELMHSSHVVPIEEFETLVSEKKRMREELKQMKQEVKEQSEEMESVKDENATLKQHNQRLVEETRQLREKQHRSELAAVQQSLTQVEKLQAQLQASKTREARMDAVLKSAEKEMKKNKQRKEELKILYAKFSSTMDSVSEKTMRLEELEQELQDAQSNARETQHQKEELEEQVAQLRQEKSDVYAAQCRERDGTSEELAEVQMKYAESRKLESLEKELTSKMQAEIAELKSQNEALKEQQVKQDHQSVGQPSNEGDTRNADIDNTLVVQVAEKEALQMFIQQYYSVAEEKCSRLLATVSEFESQKTWIQEQTKECCSVLRMCTQVDACDESIRASLLDIMATLEGLT
ncbi:hypothetical protein PHYPSEUDO_010271 [Phytophthora pseudosyringae]|uniref:Uncharacterized protein n=1 Tax=Phytophthora pseudosyringae TaxID=221518 RepID=A0A8T1VFQ7_9STRA|nr:hypothetical protein PHYPSEUDO_010271 [Phytophthora pseudosyringae]